MLAEVGNHHVRDGGIDRRRGVVIEIDGAGHGIHHLSYPLTTIHYPLLSYGTVRNRGPVRISALSPGLRSGGPFCQTGPAMPTRTPST